MSAVKFVEICVHRRARPDIMHVIGNALFTVITSKPARHVFVAQHLPGEPSPSSGSATMISIAPRPQTIEHHQALFARCGSKLGASAVETGVSWRPFWASHHEPVPLKAAGRASVRPAFPGRRAELRHFTVHAGPARSAKTPTSPDVVFPHARSVYGHPAAVNLPRFSGCPQYRHSACAAVV